MSLFPLLVSYLEASSIEDTSKETLYVHFTAHVVPTWTTLATSKLVYVLFVPDVVDKLLP